MIIYPSNVKILVGSSSLLTSKYLTFLPDEVLYENKRSSCIPLSKILPSDLANISQRIRYLRGLMGLDRPSMEARHQIKVTSLEKWESGSTNITPKNITRLINAALDHSIECTSEWLINGEGIPPRTVLPSAINQPGNAITNKTVNILRDLNYFRNTYPNGITLMVTDDSMAPFYVNGDFVGGEFMDLEDLKSCLDRPCIVQTVDGKIRLRRVGYDKGAWLLFGTNIKHVGSPYVEFNVNISKVAPVFWHRMKF